VQTDPRKASIVWGSKARMEKELPIKVPNIFIKTLVKKLPPKVGDLEINSPAGGGQQGSGGWIFQRSMIFIIFFS